MFGLYNPRGYAVAGGPGRSPPVATNAGTEGFNQICRQVKRVGCWFANAKNTEGTSCLRWQSPDRDRRLEDQGRRLKVGEPRCVTD